MYMTRTARVLLPLALLPSLLLTACGTDKVVDTGRAPLAPVPDRAELTARAEALGFAPGLVYVTEAPGFTLARQSVGVYGADGFSAAYWSRRNSAQLLLHVDRGTMTAESCPERPLGRGTEGPVGCERDGDAWYRTSAGQHEYAVPRDGHLVLISAATDAVDRATLRTAARAAHRPTDAELACILPRSRHDEPRPALSSPHDGQPAERGDLPPVGDGAPDNEVGTSG
ncbi:MULTISPECIES: hypothetical protein [Streptomyces]|jgi:hypothetical protein|uniref:Membrane lipoprotein n=1 Tax=Streptomyces bottropensis ATCC 25435 TaxID=1054862 RepID=M3EBI9_9ACTN|nr:MULTISPECIES: hypothetical protein [Streptomyces]EMF53546.1 hypothetical protein SBD_5090 [Streptomyces bottropensis ATCC 25435]MZD17563.1 hypothetical protein [Streptomyces sp. SID5476]